MILHEGFLMIEPQGPPSPQPVIDGLTKRVAAALRQSRIGPERWRGKHQCRCGALSTNTNHWVQVGGEELLSNSLATHYMAYHRHDVPQAELEKVRLLENGEVEPSLEELQAPTL